MKKGEYKAQPRRADGDAGAGVDDILSVTWAKGKTKADVLAGDRRGLKNKCGQLEGSPNPRG